jgi:hypothetical protein
MLKRGARVVFPCVAVTAAGRMLRSQFIDQGMRRAIPERACSFDHVAVIEQGLAFFSRFSH